ncbi:spore protease YyaC [Cohnella nanjingensis]|uniref:spore protease YyaC n=1 Tax=Cohnella nanjingensis TaxID=1387779 RepID=UPI0028B0FB97|nr:spore protease YyaC [Cohnella nanjingensis]
MTPLSSRTAAEDASALAPFFADLAARHALADLTFVCIGTDRSTGDSLGPWVGTLLEERGFPRVVGTLREPCDADRLAEAVAALSPEATVVAVDACLGRPENVGRFLLSAGPLVPARSVGRSFPGIGHYSVAAIVNAVGPKPYWTLQTTSLYRVMGMARQIADAASLYLGSPHPILDNK